MMAETPAKKFGLSDDKAESLSSSAEKPMPEGASNTLLEEGK